MGNLRHWINVVSMVTELRDSIYTNMQDLRVPVYRNPTKAEVQNLLRRSKYHHLRGVIIGDDLYLWDAYGATHYEIARHLGYGLVDCYNIEIAEDTVTYLVNAMLYPKLDPDAVVEKLRQMPTFRTMQVTQRPWRNR